MNDSLVTIRFDPDGNIKSASKLVLEAMGYQLDQVQGKHHRIFCDSKYTETQEYRNFWHDLAKGGKVRHV